MVQPTAGLGEEFDRIARGGLASSTEARLKELLGWGGSTSFQTPPALSIGAELDMHPVGQVIGLAAGVLRHGVLRTTHAGQGRVRLGVARYRERSGPVQTWSGLRQRALARLAEQATILGADAVIGISAARELDTGQSALPTAQVRFSGTAVQVDAWRRRKTPPVLTLASAQELWAMGRGGLEPVGIAGGFAQVDALLSGATMFATGGGRLLATNAELADVTKSVYEARRLALDRLSADARRLGATGVLGINLEFETTASAHVLASAVRRVSASVVQPQQVLALSDAARG